MTDKSNSKGGVDNTTHHLLHLKEIPEGLWALRNELVLHEDILEYARKGVTFEESLARIALQVDIALDGNYDVNTLCTMLADVLRVRRTGVGFSSICEKHKLKPAELVEKEGTVELVDTSIPTVAPEKEKPKIILN